jgi:hypothetical protein
MLLNPFWILSCSAVRVRRRTDVPPATLLATFVGPLYVRLLITDERIDREFVENVIDAGLDGVRVARNGPDPDGRT